MGKTHQADIPGNEHTLMFDVASLASNAASVIRVLFEAPCDLLITEAAFIPDGGNQAGHGTSYRDLTLLDGGAAGAGTAVSASKRLSATGASLTPIDLTVTASLSSLDDGDLLIIKKGASIGGATSDTKLQSGMLRVSYREL